ncbi:MAG TPA: uracil-DNA glycosylase, partial [Longimicrobiaceae bacterium]|nr:uracil-DNA glycosylase [Longimicrobiaceae bacterium]
MKLPLPDGWQPLLKAETESDWFARLRAFVDAERASHTVYPPEDEVFSAFRLTPFAKARVLVLGQDPYHGPGQAHGLAFSVRPGVRPPPSLANIFKELKADLGCRIPNNGYLAPWAQQGV